MHTHVHLYISHNIKEQSVYMLTGAMAIVKACAPQGEASEGVELGAVDTMREHNGVQRDVSLQHTREAFALAG